MSIKQPRILSSAEIDRVIEANHRYRKEGGAQLFSEWSAVNGAVIGDGSHLPALEPVHDSDHMMSGDFWGDPEAPGSGEVLTHSGLCLPIIK